MLEGSGSAYSTQTAIGRIPPTAVGGSFKLRLLSLQSDVRQIRPPAVGGIPGIEKRRTRELDLTKQRVA
jgi:hypothetical protein